MNWSHPLTRRVVSPNKLKTSFRVVTAAQRGAKSAGIFMDAEQIVQKHTLLNKGSIGGCGDN